MTMFSLFRALVAVSVVAFASPAAAAPQIVEGTWMETKSTSCNNTSSCTAVFTAVQAGKTLVVQNLACKLGTQQTALVRSLYLFNGVQTAFVNAGAPTTFNGLREFAVNTEVLFVVKAAAIPRVLFFSTGIGTQSINCTLTGTLRP